MRRAILLLLVLCIAPQVARAASPPTAPPGLVPLTLKGDPEATYRLRVEGNPSSFACRGGCIVWVFPGRYRLQVDETPDTIAGERMLDVHGASTATVTARSKSTRYTGLAFALLGTAATVIGGAGLVSTLVKNADSDRDGYPGKDQGVSYEDHNASVARTELLYGVLMLGGIVTMIPSWIYFGRSSPSVEIEAAPNASLGFVPALGGLAWGPTLRF